MKVGTLKFTKDGNVARTQFPFFQVMGAARLNTINGDLSDIFWITAPNGSGCTENDLIYKKNLKKIKTVTMVHEY